MKKIIAAISLLLCVHLSSGQRNLPFSSPERLFNEAKTMYEDGNYAGCIDKLNQYKQLPSTLGMSEEADFLLLASDFRMGRKDVSYDLKDFLDTYPSSPHRNEVCFMIGSDHFAKGEYRKAIFWLEETKPSYLTYSEQPDHAYRLALSYLETGKTNEAERLFNSLKTGPYRDAANYYLGYMAYLNKDYTKALAQFNPLKNNLEFQPEILYYMNQINFVQGRYSQVISEGNNLLAKYSGNPLNTETERIVGISYYYEGNYTQALAFLEKYLAKAEAPLNSDYYLAGLSAYELGAFQQAVDLLNKSNPGDDELGQNINFYLGQAHLKTGNSQSALLAFESASRMSYNPTLQESAMYNYAMLLHKHSVSAFGESVTVLEQFLNQYPNSEYADKVNDALVEVYLTTSNYDTALASINKIRQPSTKILRAKQTIYYYKGTVDFTNALYDQAIVNFTEAIAQGDYAPTEKNASYYWRGESKYRKGDYKGAISDYQTYLSSGDRAMQALANYGMGYSYFKQEQFTESKTYFDRFVQQERSRNDLVADAYSRIGDTQFYKRQFGEAQQSYAKAVQSLPSAGDYALFQEGYALGLQKDYSGKIAKMDQLIREYPASAYIADAMYEKGRTYVLQNNNSSAIATYKQLIAQFPNNAYARKAGLQIGLLYYNADNLPEAIKAYKEVVSLYPGSEETQVALQDLRSIYMETNEVSTYVAYVNSLEGTARINATEQDSLTYMAAERVFLSGDYKKAIEGMQNYMQSFPSGAFSTNANYYLGSSHYLQGNYADAKTELTKVLDRGANQFTEQALVYMQDIAYRDKDYTASLNYSQRLEPIASNKANREKAQMGIIRSAFELKQYNTVVTTVNTLHATSISDPEIGNEARYYRGKALMNLGEKAQAIQDYEALAQDTRTVYGAEAKYLLGTHYFTSGNNAKAKEVMNEYFQVGTPHQYWLAKSFILMSDIFASEGDKLQARQYLESLKNNYPESNDDIHYIIQDRLNILSK
ncbi:tetratricopeptide repeat protein [Bacteroidales bacterium OttesenSCG-928-L03]|nr:tetratricopeptide repeat protein [Bacteroidales bacterium OttesenSCG-928-L03]